MRALLFVITVFASAIATQLISTDEVEVLFKKYMRKSLSEAEKRQFEDVVEILRRPEHVSTKSIDDASHVRATFDCLVCRSAFATVIEGVKNGDADEDVIDVVISLCSILGFESEHVCQGVVTLNVPIITYIIRNTPEITPRLFCGHVLQNVVDPNFCAVNDDRFDWTVTLPPRATPTNPPAVDTKPLRVALLTDAHIDPKYEAFGVAACGEPTCCRKGQTLKQNLEYRSHVNESIIARALVNKTGNVMLDLDQASTIRQIRSSSQTRYLTPRNVEPAGYWGDYRDCDTPLWAFDDVIDTVSQTHKDIDVVYYIGDSIDHHVWETTYELIDDVNRYVIDKIRKSFGDDVLVIPTLGNHESQPTNQFAPHAVIDNKMNTTWLYNGLAEKWDLYLTDEAKATLRERGDFAMMVRPGLKVISLNNNVAYRYNWWLAFDPVDAKKHLDWMIEELYKSEQAGEKVHIITHIPPGVNDLTHAWTREYNRIVNRFSSTITAEFNGHTHSDEFKIFYDDEGTPINMAWGAGSTTSYSFFNLNYKIVDFNSATYEPESIVNYVYNLTEANLTPERKPHWFQLYDMKNSFGLSDLSPASMHDLVNRMVTTDKFLLDVYNAFYAKMNDDRWENCSRNIYCKLDNICKTVVTVLWEGKRCEALRQLYFNSL